jgi:hypothetical protein
MILSTAGSVINTEDSHEDNSFQVPLPAVFQDAIVTTSKEQSISEKIWQHVIPHSTMLWPGLVFVITGGIILGLVRGRRIAFLVSLAVA